MTFSKLNSMYFINIYKAKGDNIHNNKQIISLILSS